MNPIAEQQLQDLRANAGAGAELRERVQTELRALSEAIRRADGERWQRVMPGREWSPAEEAEHIVMVNEGTARVIGLLRSDKELRPTTGTYTEYRPDGRRLAPPSVQPSGNVSAAELLARNEALLGALNVEIEEPSNRQFFHPAYGPLDALDWLRIVPWHTRGHRKGIEAGLENA